MSELLSTQRALQNYLLSSNTSESPAVDALVVESEQVSRSGRLHIYANAYRSRLVEALAVDFGVLHAYLGDDAFSDLIHAYIEKHPSPYFSLRNVGIELPNFLQTTAPYAEHIELYELAIFEWALCHAFDATDAIDIDATFFSTLPPEQWADLTLNFLPSLRLISMRSNAAEIWKSLSADHAPPALDISVQAKSWIVWRRDLKLLFRPLDAVEKAALDVVMRGSNFADMCEVLAGLLPESEVPQRSVTLLQQWLNDGLIAAP